MKLYGKYDEVYKGTATYTLEGFTKNELTTKIDKHGNVKYIKKKNVKKSDYKRRSLDFKFTDSIVKLKSKSERTKKHGYKHFHEAMESLMNFNK